MKIKKIYLNNYRNYSDIRIDFSDGLNVIVGANAQGNTNLLEAIYMCSIGRSLRVNKEKQTINFDKNNAQIIVEIEKKYGRSTIDIILSRNAKKTVRINKIPIKKIGELMGGRHYATVIFATDKITDLLTWLFREKRQILEPAPPLPDFR